MFFSLLSFLSFDPIKSCLYLVLSVLVLSSFFRGSLNLWFSYFVRMLFLSGIFVILVYFSRLSAFFFFRYSFFSVIFLFFLSFFFFHSGTLYVFEFVGVFFCSFFSLPFIYVLFSFFLFLFFIRYYLNFSGGLRRLFFVFIF